MLRDLTALCRQWGLGKQHAEDVLDYAIKNWTWVTKHAESRHGAFNTPSRPTIEFLFRHISVTVNLWLFENNLEIRDGVPQPKVTEPSKPHVTINEPLSKSAASIAPKKYVDMEFDPPALFFLDEWSELPAEAN